MKILIINGANLNLLGLREPEIYGSVSMENYLEKLRTEYNDYEINYFQSNREYEIIEELQRENFDALIINPGAFSHYSYAISDALKNLKNPYIEVHISNIYKREDFRKNSVTALYSKGVITGLGLEGYKLAISFFTTN